MELWERELYVNRIISGTLRCKLSNNLLLLIQKPSRQDRYVAQEIFAEAYREAELSDNLTEDELFSFLMSEGIWDEEKEELLNQLPKEIENFKVGLLQATFKSNERKTIRKALETAKNKLGELYSERNSYNHTSCLGVAALARTRYLLGASLVYPDGSKFFNHNFWEEPSRVLDEVFEIYTHNQLPEETYRILARTDPWRNYWSLRNEEGSLFGENPVDYTDEQKILVQWSKIYDSAYQHPESPSDEVIEDDDMFDGWLILQRRERENQHKQSTAKNLTNNQSILNCSEQFYVAETAEDAQKIYELNNPLARHTIRKRQKLIEEKGTVSEMEMPDTKKRLRMEITQRLAESMKKG